jgi:hypothetical protein
MIRLYHTPYGIAIMVDYRHRAVFPNAIPSTAHCEIAQAYTALAQLSTAATCRPAGCRHRVNPAVSLSAPVTTALWYPPDRSAASILHGVPQPDVGARERLSDHATLKSTAGIATPIPCDCRGPAF